MQGWRLSYGHLYVCITTNLTYLNPSGRDVLIPFCGSDGDTDCATLNGHVETVR